MEVDPAGLKDALEELVASVNAMNEFDISLITDEKVVLSDNAIATQLYRIAQEALRNALEHGEVSSVTIRLRHENDALTLTIQDNGIGLDPEGTSSNGSGLMIMQHRAELIGAMFSIDSVKGEGTSVTCRLPIKKA